MEEYIRDSQEKPFLACYMNDWSAGFVVLNAISKDCADIFVIGIKKKSHQMGIGSVLNEAYGTMARSIKFYRDGLGYKTNCKKNNPPKGNGFSEITLAYNVEHKEDVDSVIELVRNVSGKIVKEPPRHLLGWISCLFFRFRWILLGSCMGFKF